MPHSAKSSSVVFQSAMLSRLSLLSACSVALLAPMTSHAATDDSAKDSYVSAMNYVSLDVQGDNADSRDQSLSGSVGIGKYVWLQGSVGKLTDSSSTSLGDLKYFGAGVGLRTEHLMFAVDTRRHSSDGAYRQRDVNASADWIGDRFTIGLDLSHRETDNSLDTVRAFPALGQTNVAMHIDETITGRGTGAHASFDITDAFSMSLRGMSYSYDSDYTLTSSTNPILIRRLLTRYPTLAQTVYLNNSGVTRSLALLDSSYSLGASYQFSSFLLGAQYIIDKALDSDDKTRTFILSGSFFVGDHIAIAPSLGRSKSDTYTDVNFGGVSVSYNW